MKKIIFLNGVGSSGKTSICKSIQLLSNAPWLHVSMDNFINMLPEKFIGYGEKAPEGYYSFLHIKDEIGERVGIKTHCLGEAFFAAIPKFIALLAQENNIIIDEVLLRDDLLKTYIKELKNFKVYFIGIFCELNELQKREKQRGDREIGLALSQLDIVHNGIKIYDLKLNTTNISPRELATQVLRFIDQTPYPQGFKKMGH